MRSCRRGDIQHSGDVDDTHSSHCKTGSITEDFCKFLLFFPYLDDDYAKKYDEYMAQFERGDFDEKNNCRSITDGSSYDGAACFAGGRRS